MQRRTLIASLALMVVSARNAFGAKSVKSQNVTSPKATLPESAVQLAQGSKFQLPGDAKDGQTLFFQPDASVKSSPSEITAAHNHKIMGLQEALEVDEGLPFAMTFDAEHKSWIISAKAISSI